MFTKSIKSALNAVYTASPKSVCQSIASATEDLRSNAFEKSIRVRAIVKTEAARVAHAARTAKAAYRDSK